MAVSVEHTGSLGRKVTVSIPSGEVQSQLDAKYNEVSKTIRMDGFRTGHVPRKLIEKRYGASIQAEVLEKMVQQHFSDALTKESLKPAGQPHIDGLKPLAEIKNEDVTFTATFEVLPEIALKSFADIKVAKKVATVEDKDVEGMLDKLREQMADFSVVERAAQEGDRLKVDLERTLEEGEPQKQTDTYIMLGNEGMLAGINEALIGQSAGEKTHAIETQYPEDWHESDVVGKTLHLNVVIKEVAEKSLLDDKLLSERLGFEGDLDKAREKIKESMAKEAEDKSFALVKEVVLDALLEQYNELELPKTLLDQEIAQMKQQEAHEHQHDEKADHDEEKDAAVREEEASKRVCLGLLMNEIIETKQLKADPAKLKAEVIKIAQQFGGSPEEMQSYFKNEQLIAHVQRMLLVDEAVRTILAEAVVEEETLTFDELTEAS